jgi:hypothetical protein
MTCVDSFLAIFSLFFLGSLSCSFSDINISRVSVAPDASGPLPHLVFEALPHLDLSQTENRLVFRNNPISARLFPAPYPLQPHQHVIALSWHKLVRLDARRRFIQMMLVQIIKGWLNDRDLPPQLRVAEMGGLFLSRPPMSSCCHPGRPQTNQHSGYDGNLSQG